MSALRMLPRTNHSTIALVAHQATDREEGVLMMPVPLLDGEPKKTKPRRKKAQKFVLRSMYKYELADWYGETKRRFSSLYFKPVMRELKRLGYTPSTRLLTRTMVQIIVAHHGEPDIDCAK